MAFTDWTVVNSNPTWARDVGVAHSLAGVGSRLRRFAGLWPPTDLSAAWGSMCLTSLLNPGDSSVIAVSQRVLVRYTQAFRGGGGGGNTGDGICLAAKGYYSGAAPQVWPGGGGYRAIFGRHDGTTDPAETGFGLRLHRNGTSESVGAVEAATFTPIQGNWYWIRLDCIPLSATKDVLRVYSGTGTLGAVVWEKQIEVFPEQGMGNGWCSNSEVANTKQAYGIGWRQYSEIDAAAQMDVHHYRALVRTGGPFPDQE